MNKCCISNCNNDSKFEFSKICDEHYQILFQNGRVKGKYKECWLVGCNKKHYCQWYCRSHYGQSIEPYVKNITIKNVDKYFDKMFLLNNLKQLANKDIECLVCNHQYVSNYEDLINNNFKCPNCINIQKQYLLDLNTVLIDINIENVENCINFQLTTPFKCLVLDCNHNWETTIDKALQNTEESPCPKCNRHVKITNEIIDERLLKEKRLIKRIGDITGYKEKTKFQCLLPECNMEFETTPFSICAGHGCKYFNNHLIRNVRKPGPKKDPIFCEVEGCVTESFSTALNIHMCQKHYNRVRRNGDPNIVLPPALKTPQAEVTRILLKYGLITDDMYNNMRALMTVTCIDCGWIGQRSLSHVLSNEWGCRECFGPKYTETEINAILLAKEIEKLEPYINNKAPTKLKCLATGCNYSWVGPLDCLINTDRRCGRCAKVAKLTNEIVDERLKYRNIIRVGDYIDIGTPILFECGVCKKQWPTTPGCVFNGSGCPECNIGKNEKIVHCILENEGFIYDKWKKLKDIDSKQKNQYSVDCYISFIKTIIEYDGEQHHKATTWGSKAINAKEIAEKNLIKQQLRDKYVDNFAIEIGFDCIHIDGRKYYGTKLVKYMLEVIVPMLKEKMKKE